MEKVTSMETSNINTTNPSLPKHDNTTTFLIGFGILLIFVILGILASAFLCITLKKDPYLWEAERERQLQEKQDDNLDESSKERDKVNPEDNKLDGVDV